MTALSLRGAWPFLSSLSSLLDSSPPPPLAEAFSHIRLPDIRTAPLRPSAPFGACERTVGAPAALFARKLSPDKPARGRTALLRAWRGTLKRLTEFGVRGRIAGVNRYINHFSGRDEIAGYYGHAPLSPALSAFACADGSHRTAMAKYLSLRKLGFHPDRLRILWLADRDGIVHAVTLVALDGRNFVLDQSSDQVLSDEEAAPHAWPCLSINEGGLYLHWRDDENHGPDRTLELLEALLRRH